MPSGIYAIRNRKNGKIYVGSTSSFADRWSAHRVALRAGRHGNAHLQAAWKLDGEMSFVFEVLVEQSSDDRSALNSSEESLMAELGSLDPMRGYNIASASTGMTGYRHTESAKERISQAARGRVPSELERRLLSERNRSPEIRQKISAAKKNKPLSEANRRALIGSHKDRVTSQGVRDAISRAHLGQKLSASWKERISNSLKGIRCGDNRKSFVATDASGNEYHVLGLQPFCALHGLAYTTMLGCAAGRVKRHKGWTCRRVD